MKEILNSNTQLRFISHSTDHSWGKSILIMEENGNAFARVYWYFDDNLSVCLDWLSVSENSRRNGIGTKLQEIREKLGTELGATTSYLWVEKGTWMHEWYKRRGYEDYKDNEKEKNAIWMQKSLISYNHETKIGNAIIDDGIEFDVIRYAINKIK
jgi:N-acetylglutamate synthase-like GNAT family acetyltransferase